MSSCNAALDGLYKGTTLLSAMATLASHRVFDAVFPSAAHITSATPTATPRIGAGAFGESFASTQEENPVQGNPAAETIKWERAWHVVTDFLALPNDLRRSRDPKPSISSWFKPWTTDVSHAITYIILHGSTTSLSPTVQHQNIFEWYLHEVGRHYLEFEFPEILKVWTHNDGLHWILNKS